MKKPQLEKILTRLEALYTAGFKNPAQRAEYADAFMPLDFEIMNKVIDKIRSEGITDGQGNINRSYMPTIAEILALYKQLEQSKKQQLEETIKNYCPVCDNQGFVFYKKVEENNEYEFIAYCTYCDRGQSYMYDGTKSNPKSNYYIPPIDAYFDEEAIKSLIAKNMKNREVKNNVREL